MRRVLVVGDVMLDVSVECTVSRVSPEAPVIVGKEVSRREALGGAANVAANLKALGVDIVHLYGVVAHDAAGTAIGALCDEAGIQCTFMEDPEAPTTVKTRYADKTTALFRHDVDSFTTTTGSPNPDIYIPNVAAYDAVVLVDYDKGTTTLYDFPQIIIDAKEYDIPVVVDCKPVNLSLFQGATVLTPNIDELSEMVRRTLPAQMWEDSEETLLFSDNIEALLGEMGITTIVCTKGQDGLVVFSKERYVCGDSVSSLTGIPIAARAGLAVQDVTGAGDVVTAAIAAAITLQDAASVQAVCEYANTAAGLAVTQPGTTVVTHEAVEAEQARVVAQSKILTRTLCLPFCKARQKLGETLVFTNGCFDLLHPGHVHLLREAKSKGDYLIVAVNTDESIRTLKGKDRPVLPLHIRMEALASVAAVDMVVAFSEDTPEKLIQELKPDVLVKGKHGTDCPYTDAKVPGAAYMLARDARVEFVAILPGYSTSAVLAGVPDSE